MEFIYMVSQRGSKYDVFARPIATGWVYSSNAAVDALNPVAIAATDSLTMTQYYPNKSWVKNQGARVLKDGSVSTVRDYVWSYQQRHRLIDYRGNPGWQGKQHLLSTTFRNGVDAKNTPIVNDDPDVPGSVQDHGGVDWATTAFNGAQFPYGIYRYLFSNDGTQEVRTTTKSLFDNGNRLNNLAFDYGVSGAGPNNSSTPVLATMEYTIKDQLKRKNIGATATGNFLQNIDYFYNTRGWLTNINGLQVYPSSTAILSASSTIAAPLIQNLTIVPFLAQTTRDKAFLDKAESLAPVLTDVNADLFNEAIYYSGADSRFNAVSQYNGNIQAAAWQVANRNPQAYGYTYDELDRVTNATNYDLQTTSGSSGTVYTPASTAFIAQDKFNEKLLYDKRGNISALQRNGLVIPDMTSQNQVAGTFGLIDNLNYTYDNQNRITNIDDYSNATKGFRYAGYNANPSYTYDANGNLISDRNKGITSIAYNFLNLPQTITFSNTNVIQFVYDASGAKLRKITIDNTVSPSVTTTTDYINGVEYKNGVTQRIANAEGQIYRNPDGSYQRQYDLKDHLGNTRVTFADINNDGLVNDAEILQSNNYYAFGLNMEMNTNGAQGTNKYQYNGKEWNDDFSLGLNDYGARMYDPAIGRWNSIEPFADIFYRWSPYNYVLDNPVRYADYKGSLPVGPGDLFPTIEEAAINWAQTYNGASIRVNREYGSTIYAIIKDGVTSYAYSAPKISEEEAGVTPSKAPEGTRPVAAIHSHSAYSGGNPNDHQFDDNNFSPQDESYSKSHGYNLFVSTPSGTLQEFNSVTSEVSRVNVRIAADQCDPESKKQPMKPLPTPVQNPPRSSPSVITPLPTPKPQPIQVPKPPAPKVSSPTPVPRVKCANCA